VAKGKKVLFAYILKILGGEGPRPGSFWEMLKKHCCQLHLLKKPVMQKPYETLALDEQLR
jgi:hypothetical protein